MSDQPAYILSCRPHDRAVVRDFFNPYGEVFALLSRPPETRDASFGLRTAAMPELHGTEYWEVHAREALSARTRRLRVYADGSVIFRASANGSFLSWPRDMEDRVVNPIVVADSIVSFTRFVRALGLLMSHRPERLEFGVEIRNAALSEPPLKLYSGRLRSEPELFTIPSNQLRGVGEANPKRSVTVATTDLIADESSANDYSGADAIAFLAVKQFYDIFGFKEADIPYVQQVGQKPRISIESFKG